MPAWGSLILIALIVGLVVLVRSVRRWDRRERELSMMPSALWSTMWVRLAPGIKDAEARFARGHAKAAESITPMVRFVEVVFQEREGDTSATVWHGFMVPTDQTREIESAYRAYFSGGEIAFYEDESDIIDRLKAEADAGHKPDAQREWLRDHLAQLRLA
jgi:hypothetical protein